MHIFGRELGHAKHRGQVICLYMITGRLTRPAQNPCGTRYVGRLTDEGLEQETTDNMFPPPFDLELPLDALAEFALRLRGTETPNDVRFVIRDDHVPAIGIGYDEHTLVSAAIVEGMRAFDTAAHPAWRELHLAQDSPRG